MKNSVDISTYGATMQNVADVIGSLKIRLDEPFVTVNYVTDDFGIMQAQDEYARLMRNKSPKRLYNKSWRMQFVRLSALRFC